MGILNLLEAISRSKLLSPPFERKSWRWIRIWIFVSLDFVLISASYWLSYVLRLDDFRISGYVETFRVTLPWFILSQLLVFFLGGLYQQVWRYANYNSLILIVRNVILGSGLFIVLNVILSKQFAPPRSVPVIATMILVAALFLVRFSWRAWSHYRLSLAAERRTKCLLYGAGSAGDLFARHVAANPNFPYRIVGFIDDDRNKRGRVIHGFKILGSGDELPELAKKHGASVVVIALHAAPGKIIRSIFEKCQAADLTPLMMPDLAKAMTAGNLELRKLDIADLLRRAPKNLDEESIRSYFSSRTILVTGAGGSIGSEISRQLASFKPEKLILFDSSEYNLYKIEQELRESPVSCEIVPILGSVVDRQSLERVFVKYRPSAVLHAAAYKHVPMIEANPIEGIVNNIQGTKNCAELAIKYEAHRFLLISTDKAVRPTNIMGATKRACEILVQSLAAQNPNSKTGLCAVRFGNVLGSSGSVIPRFLEQIQRGGPVTVTHPEVTRYFMLTSEAVGLVLKAVTLSKGGEIFVLDMGESVKIVDMARQLIRLAGKIPDRDIKIEFTGLRPGEKLYEELIIDSTETTELFEDIHIALPKPFDPEDSFKCLGEIIRWACGGDDRVAAQRLKQLTGHKDATPCAKTGKLQSPDWS